jgi:outer membrane receptor for ferrienterochelin and colicin
MKEGNMKEYHGNGSIGLIASKLSFEGPVKRDTSSFIISARRTYLDLLLRPALSLSPSTGTLGYFFQDVNAKVNYKFSDKSRLYLSSYLGKDDFYHQVKENYSSSKKDYSYNRKSGLEWGNQTGVLRWNYIFNPKLFSNLTCSYSNFKFLVTNKTKEKTNQNTQKIDYKYNSGIQDVKTRYTFQYIPSPEHHIRFGIDAGYSVFNPGITTHSNSNDDLNTGLNNTFGNEKIHTYKYAAFIEDEWNITDRTGANLGVNYNGFLVNGAHYKSIEPRISLRYLLNKEFSIKGSWGIMNQYLHMLNNSTIGLPTDLWVPSTNSIEPVSSSQYTLSLSAKLASSINITLEGFYKEMTGLVEYKEGASYFSQRKNWQEKVTSGNGTSYGSELFIEKSDGKTTGWLSYTLSWSNRTFEKLNFGETFPFKYDRRHVFNINMNHRFNKNISINGTWIYKTGRTATYPTHNYMSRGIEQNEGTAVNYYQKRNNLRFPSYHRLDVGINFKKEKQWGTRTWRVGFYNTYSRINPFYLYYNNEKESFMKVGILPVLPFVSYNFKF